MIEGVFEVTEGSDMLEIKIFSEWMANPLHAFDPETSMYEDLPQVVGRDPELNKLTQEYQTLFESFSDYTEYDLPRLDQAKERRHKEQLLDLLKKINQRLDFLNDGSYRVVDMETPEINRLK